MNKKLYRSKNERFLLGVCGGISEYFDIDANIVRLAYILCSFLGGVGLLLYFVIAVIIPENTNEVEIITNRKKKLYRSFTDKKISGLCGGIGNYFSIDSTIIRVLLAFSCLAFGCGFFTYIVMSYIVPIEN